MEKSYETHQILIIPSFLVRTILPTFYDLIEKINILYFDMKNINLT